MLKVSLLWLFAVLLAIPASAQKKVQFASADGVQVTADLYEADSASSYIVLCHLAGHSRGEYLATAKRLNSYGYNCLAVDARSGDKVFGVVNETAIAARRMSLPTNYTDAEPDIRAAVDFAYRLSGRPVVLLGSSYSASLVLMIAVDHPHVERVAAFSPGEYFGDNVSVKKAVDRLAIPVFVTSSREEAPKVAQLVSDVKRVKVQQYVPEAAGAHGSIALWESTPGCEEYWKALVQFLKLSVR